MDHNESKKLTENTLEILKLDSFNKVFKSAISEMRPSKLRLGLLSVYLLLLYLFFSCLVFTNNAVIKVVSVLEIINNTYLPLFGIILTGYSIFQALANGQTLKTLLSRNEGNKSMFLRFNSYFFVLSIIYLTIILGNMSLLFIVKNLDPSFHLPWFSNRVNTQICVVFTTIYVTIMVYFLIEFKSFIYNLYQCFSINTYEKAREYIKQSDLYNKN